MVVWINGAFGVGKTQTAYELNKVIEGSKILDPESAGFFLRKIFRGIVNNDDFQDFSTWRKLVSSIIIEMSEGTKSTLIVPMTITNEGYFHEIVDPIIEKGIEFKSYTLMAKKETIEKRLIKRGDKNAWNFKQVDRCVMGLHNKAFQGQIDTDKLNLYEVVDFICQDLNITKKLISPNRIARLLRRAIVALGNIRIFS